MRDTSTKSLRIYTRKDALLFKHEVIHTWKPVSEVWAFKYGDGILSGLTSFGSFFICHMFRRELKIRPYARLTCYLPVVGISGMVTLVFHEMVISPYILQSNSCPLCVFTKAGLAQGILGLAYPMVAAATVCFYMADRLLTYPVPPLVRAPREVFHLFQKLALKNKRPLLVIGALHMIAASFITFQKQNNFIDLNFRANKSSM